MKRIILSTFLVLFTAVTFAQSKVGSIDGDFILSKMPELTQANEQLKNYRLDLDKQLQTKIKAYEATLSDAQAKFKKMSKSKRQTMQEKLNSLENEVNKFQANGAQLIQLKQNEVLQPLYKKIGDEVAKYAEANGYTQILNLSNNSNIAYIDIKYDITTAVITQMGIPVN